MDGNRPLVSLPRAEIRSLTIALTVGADRPVIVATLGVVAILIALTPFAMLAVALVSGGIFPRILLLISGFAVIGGWLLWFAFKRRPVLLVLTTHGHRKLMFSRSVDLVAAAVFIEEVCRVFGYSVGPRLVDSRVSERSLSDG